MHTVNQPFLAREKILRAAQEFFTMHSKYFSVQTRPIVLLVFDKNDLHIFCRPPHANFLYFAR